MSPDPKKFSRWKRVLVATYTGWREHRSTTESAALAFYTLFALAPILIVSIAIAGTLFGADAVRGQVMGQFERLMGKEQSAFIQTILQRTTYAREHDNGVAAAIGVLALLLGASALFVQLQSSLNRVWEIAPVKGHFLRSLVHKRLVSLAVLLGVSFALLVSLVLSAAVDAFYGYLASRFAVPPAALLAGNFVVSLVVFTLLFAMIFRILPDREIGWREVGLGSFASAGAFEIGKWLFSLYIGRTGVATPFGSAGALVVILLWIYYATSILLVGAEFTRAHSREIGGSLPRPKPGTKAVRPKTVSTGLA